MAYHQRSEVAVLWAGCANMSILITVVSFIYIRSCVEVTWYLKNKGISHCLESLITKDQLFWKPGIGNSFGIKKLLCCFKILEMVNHASYFSSMEFFLFIFYVFVCSFICLFFIYFRCCRVEEQAAVGTNQYRTHLNTWQTGTQTFIVQGSWRWGKKGRTEDW